MSCSDAGSIQSLPHGAFHQAHGWRMAMTAPDASQTSMRLKATFGPGRIWRLRPVLQRRFDRPRLIMVRLMEGRSDLPEGGAG